MSSIQTNRMALKRPVPKDISILAEILLKEDVATYLPFTPEDVEMSQAKEILSKKHSDEVCKMWVLETLATKKKIGVVEIYKINKQHRRGVIGYYLDPAYWGRGYAYEAVKAVCEEAFSNNYARIQAEVVVGNTASMDLLQSLGFKEEGVLRSHVAAKNARKDVIVYGLLDGDIHV